MTALARKWTIPAGLALCITLVALPIAAHAAVLSNDNGGDGYVTLTGSGFDLFGSDNGASTNTTSYTTVASAASTLFFDYTYTTHDCCGAQWDPAGYVINGVFTQLSPASSDPGYSFSSSVSFSVAAGDTYGFYVYSPDSIQGRSDIAVSPTLSAVPLPASAPMFGAALIALGAFGLRLNRTKASALA